MVAAIPRQIQQQKNPSTRNAHRTHFYVYPLCTTREYTTCGMKDRSSGGSFRRLRYFAKRASPMDSIERRALHLIRGNHNPLEVRNAATSVAISAILVQTRCAICAHSAHFTNSVRHRFATLFVKWNAANEKRVVGTTRTGLGWRGSNGMMTGFRWNAVNPSQRKP